MKKGILIFLFTIVWSICSAQGDGCFKPAKRKHRNASNKGISFGNYTRRSNNANNELTEGIGIGNSLVSGVDLFYAFESSVSERIYIESEFGLSYINPEILISTPASKTETTLGAYIMTNPRYYLSFTNKKLGGYSMAHYPGMFTGLKLAVWYYPNLRNNSIVYLLGPNLGYRAVFNERFIVEGSIDLINTSLTRQSTHYNNYSTKKALVSFNASIIILLF